MKRKLLKNNSKSVRLTDEVLGYINNFEGDGFNEKFENLVLFCMSTEQERREDLQRINEQIAEKRKILDVLYKIDWTVNSMSSQVKLFENRMKDYFAELDTRKIPEP